MKRLWIAAALAVGLIIGWVAGLAIPRQCVGAEPTYVLGDR